MESIYLEIRAAEGGDHAQRIVKQQVEIYTALCKRRSL